MTLGQRIQELRKQVGMSQESLGEALGVSRQAVSKWEGDNGIPELDTLIAMSRLFGISIGELLGVEAPERTEEAAAPGLSEEQVEGILRRYAEENRQYEPQPQPKPRSRAGVAALLAVLTVLMVVLLVWVGNLSESNDRLQQTLSNLAADNESLHNLYENILEEVHDQITEALEENHNLISTFNCQVVGFDWEKQTVEVQLDATLKNYAADSELQFILDWLETDETEGRLVCDPVEGPDFSATVTIPMNYHLEVTIRVITSDGGIQEQTVDTVYGGMHPDEFWLQAYNLRSPFLITYYRGGLTVSTTEGASSVDIYSGYPQWVWPTEAHMTAWFNGEIVFDQALGIRQAQSYAEVNRHYYADTTFTSLTMREGDRLDIFLKLTDNLGRVQEFTQAVGLNGGDLVGDEVVVIPDR